MVTRPPIIPALASSRSIMLFASSAACGLLLLALLLILVGCAELLDLDDYHAGPISPNAILCSCECESPIDPNAEPSKNPITAGADDAMQGSTQATAALTGNALELGLGNSVGLRFPQLGIPPKATITSAFIQFTSTVLLTVPTVLSIHLVDPLNAAPFTASTNLHGLTGFGAVVPWEPGAWAVDETGANERTPDLAGLLQPMVGAQQYAPENAVAFIITGSGHRVARSFEGSTTKPEAPFLVVEYVPKKTQQDFLACGDPAQAATVCQGRVQANVTGIATTCKVATSCICKVKPGADASTFSAVCNDPCPATLPPLDCDPEGIAKTTAATANDTPVCVANSPLGAVLFGRFSACELDESQSHVTVTAIDDDGDPHTKGNHARGRMEFVGTPCPGGSCAVGLAHRVHVGDIVFETGPFGSDHVFTELSGVGESVSNGEAQIDPTGAGTFGIGSTLHSARGREVGGDTKAFFNSNASPVSVSLGGWQPGGACTLEGNVIQTPRVTMFADFLGQLVNQPPTAVAGPDQGVECNDIGRATFTVDASASHDPDNNVVFFGWFRGGRTGDLVGALPRILIEQPLGGPVPYVFKMIDAFGQYGEATTRASVVDTTPPTIASVAASPNRLWPPNHRLVPVSVTVDVVDICDATPTCQITSVSSNEPIDGPGDGHTTPDWVITGDLTVDLRAERAGTGTGRMYTIEVECTDSSGNSATKTVPVRVPKSQGSA